MPACAVPYPRIRADAAVRLERLSAADEDDVSDALRRILRPKEGDPYDPVVVFCVGDRRPFEPVSTDPIVLHDGTVREN
ncbi:MAG: hypothetical protein WDN46_00130 [Methylocella sp.]